VADIAQEIQITMPITSDNIAIEKYFDTKIDGLKEYICARLDGIEKATSIASEAMNTRLEGMNEFRQQLKDQSGTFITRLEHDSLIEKFDNDILRIETSINNLNKFQAAIEGKASQSAVIFACGIGITGLVISVIGLIIRFV